MAVVVRDQITAAEAYAAAEVRDPTRRLAPTATCSAFARSEQRRDRCDAFRLQEATKKFGITSVEARLAWETVDDVENMGGAIHSEALKAAVSDDCDVLSTEAKCLEFESKMQKLEELTSAAKVVNLQIKSEILKLQNLKMGTSTVAAAAAVSSSAYQEAKAEAEAAVAKHGKDSKEAAVAWESVFEIVSVADDDKVG